MGTVAPPAVIELEGLTKRYPKQEKPAVDHVSLQVYQGEIFGLLGPNGAGKTTLIRMLTTRLPPTEGRAMVAGADVVRDPVAVRLRIGVVPQQNNPDRRLTVRENLLFHAAYHGVPPRVAAQRADALLERLELTDRAGDSMERLSGGMVRRVMIARALIHEPQILFLDEPTVGLDPQSRLFLWETIQNLHREGRTIILTTHDMHEAERLCHRIAIIDHGRILAVGNLDQLRAKVPGNQAIQLEVGWGPGAPSQEQTAALAADLRRMSGVTEVSLDEPRETYTTLWVYGSITMENAAPLLTAVASHGLELRSIRLARPTLEDVFIHLTGRSLRS